MMAKNDIEDFNFLDDLLTVKEDNVVKNIDNSKGVSSISKNPTSNIQPSPLPIFNEKLISGFQEEDEFSKLERNFSKPHNYKANNSEVIDNKIIEVYKEKEDMLSSLEDEFTQTDDEILLLNKQKEQENLLSKKNKKEEAEKKKAVIKKEKELRQRELEMQQKSYEKDVSFVSVYDNEEELEDRENDFHNDDENEYSGLSPAMRAALEWEPPPPKSTYEQLVNEWIQTGWVGNLHLDQILTEAIIAGASDVHIAADSRVSMTRNGDIIRYDGYAIPDEEIMHEIVHNGILTHQQQSVFNTEFEYEGSYTIMYGPMAGRRTRLTMGKTFGKYFMVFRIISEYIPSLEELKVDEEIVKWSHFPNGLFLLCGPTGSGKTTTLASVLHNLQMTTKKKIISIEKPIEYIYPDDAPSLVVQREVGEDTRGFYEGLTSAMRQSPNVILLGEVRNTEEVTELLRAAETGHLAISTMHTNSVATTVNRIQNLFEGNEQRRIMSTLADTMRGIGNQVLVKTKDGEGRFAVRELLTVNDEIKELIIKGDIQGIRKYQIRNKATMEHGLAAAVKAGKCHLEDALTQTADPILFNKLMEEE